MPNTLSLQTLQRSKWARRTAWAVTGLLALWALAWLAVPPLLRHQAQKIATGQLGRTVTIGKVDFSPWTLELTVHDIAVATADGGAAQLAIKRVYIDGEMESLLRLAPVVDAITIDGVAARLTHLGDGHYDVDDILARLTQPSDKPAGAPLRFALYNLAVNGGTLDFTDRAVGKTHAVRDFNLGVPFLSNIASQRTIKTAPHLGFNLNGSRFDSTAQSTPFAQTHKTDAVLTLRQLDLRPYLGYLPAGLPVKLLGAVLSADLNLAFEQTPTPEVRLSGTVTADKLQVATPNGSELLTVERIDVTLRQMRPFLRTVDLSKVEITAPRLTVSRAADGTLNLLPAPSAAASATKTGAANIEDTRGSGQFDPKNAPIKAAAWQVQLAELVVKGGAASWADAAVKPTAQVSLSQLDLSASGITWPHTTTLTTPASFNGSALLDKTTLTFAGLATDQAATATLNVNGLPLAMAAPYLAQFVDPALAGQLGADAGVVWTAAGALHLTAPRLELGNLALSQGKASLATVKSITLSGLEVDLRARKVHASALAVTQPRGAIERGQDGRWMFERWVKSTPATTATTATASTASATRTTTTPWAATLDELTVAGGPITFTDKFGRKPVAVEISAIQLRAGQLVLNGSKPAPVSLSLRLGSGQAEPGTLALKGQFTQQPLAAQLVVDATRLPAHAFEPYFADALNIELLRADTSFKGDARYTATTAGPTLRVAGDVNLDDLRANSVAGSAAATAGASEELLAWKGLSLRGLDLALAPKAATRVNVRETVLSDFYARVVLRESGRFNLQDIVKSAASAGTGTTATTAASNTATAAATEGPAPIIAFGPISVVNGKVQFSDRFVKPNYSANLSELTGRLGAFSTAAVGATATLADLELRGKAEGTASLEILGKLNPLARPLAMDIKGKVRNLELPPLSPYAIKYAGHGIERGKLSVDVAYVVKPDGNLQATNKVVLNQLAFGEAVQGAPNSLPVKLAVALLADRNGVIDIDLPVSGSLNDPQFSVGAVIFKIIGNLIVKAITAPFSLLASALGGGGDELSTVAFAPGSAALADASRQGLDKVAKALVERPALKLTVVGTSRLAAERDAFQRQRLQQLLVAEKRRAAIVAGATATAQITVSAAEAPALLKEVYRRSEMPKPRNAVGLAKDLPAPEMEALLLANIPVSEEHMRELALARGVAVRDYLASQKVPAERLFLGAVKTTADTAPATGGKPVEWRPRAELNLATR